MDLQTVIDILDQLTEEHGRNVHLQIDLDDRRMDWRSMGGCDDHGLPSLHYGQGDDCRWSLTDGSGLHAHWYEDVVRFHLDEVDPSVNAVGHVVRDTWAPQGVLGGALTGLLIAKHPLGAVVGGVVGGITALAAQTRAPTQVWIVTHWEWSGYWEAERLSRAA